MASTAELRSKLLAAVAAGLAPAGFAFQRSEQRFRKSWGETQLLVHIAFIKHPDDFDATVDVAVRHNAVEERLNAVRSYLSARDKRYTATVGVELGSWSVGAPRRWTLRSASDLPSVTNGILSELRRVGVPFLERFSSLEEVKRVLDENGREALLICPFEDKRAAVLRVARELCLGPAA